MWILWSLMWLCILDLGHFASLNTLHCGLGEYVYRDGKGIKSCKPCPDGTFMDQPKHTNLECMFCSIGLFFNHEVVAENCTKTKDSVILCTRDHYRERNSGDRSGSFCQRCQRCGTSRVKDFPYRIKPCRSYSDTICGKSMYCGPGQFVYRNSRRGQESCEECPNGTFMAEPWHRNRECKKCQSVEFFDHEVEIENCTKTKDTVIQCDKNYYRVDPGPLLPKFCAKCTTCGKGLASGRPNEIQPCGKHIDTLCGEGILSV